MSSPSELWDERVAFGRLVEVRGAAKVAETLDVSRKNVAAWASGDATPSLYYRMAVGRLLEDEAAEASSEPEDAFPADPAVPLAAIAKDAPKGQPGAPARKRSAKAMSARDEVVHVITTLRGQLDALQASSEAGPREIATVANALNSSLRALSRLDGYDLSLSQVLRSSHFAIVRERIFTVLSRYPEALAAVRDAMLEDVTNGN